MFNSLASNHLVRQVFRFVVTGGLAFIIDFGLMVLLTEKFLINYQISAALSFTAAVIFNYVLSVYWVFYSHTEKGSASTLLLFIILSVIGLGINNGIMWLLVELCSTWYIFAKIFATSIVMVYNFVTRKILIEKSHTH